MPQEKGSNRPDPVVSDEPLKPQPDELARVRIVLTSDDETPTIALIEERLWHVRQLYALFFLLRAPVHGDTDVLEIAALYLGAEEKDDLEQFVPIKLELMAAGLGSSLWVDVLNSLKDIPKVLPVVSAAAAASLMAVSLLFKQGRIIFWQGQEAATSIKVTQSDVIRAEGDAKIARAKMDEQLVPFNAMVDSLKRIEDLKDGTPEQKQVLQRFLFHQVDGLFGTNSAEKMRDLPAATQQTLPPAQSETEE